MSNPTAAEETYRRQLTACARAMSIADNAAIQRRLPQNQTIDRVKFFTDGNLEVG